MTPGRPRLNTEPKRDAVLEEALFFASQGQSDQTIMRALGYRDRESMYRTLRRAGLPLVDNRDGNQDRVELRSRCA